MSVFHRILVAYDGSQDSDAALALAVSLARDQSAQLTLLTVVPDVPLPVTSVAVGAYDLNGVYLETQQNAQATIPDDVSVTAILRHGNPAHCIAEAAADHDLVVMGTHGRSRIGDALAGSVSRAVVHSLRGAVLITRAPEAAAAAPDAVPE
ncbi:MAG: universal stress protein [Solirubrobacteraceae bacterium]